MLVISGPEFQSNILPSLSLCLYKPSSCRQLCYKIFLVAGDIGSKFDVRVNQYDDPATRVCQYRLQLVDDLLLLVYYDHPLGILMKKLGGRCTKFPVDLLT